ncbi:hypothetical protein BBJ28_00010485 [Nothophytophthora sp. Chile5]|nr:hypothetical protein BBJ28_00010485 [Nothophytophthora sp. Chile5]
MFKMDTLYFAWQLTALISGLVSSGAMIYFFVKYPSARVHPGPVLMCIFMSVSISNLARVALQSWHPMLDVDKEGGLVPATIARVANHELGEDKYDLEPYVSVFFWFDFFFNTSSTLWFLMLAMDLIFSLSNPFLPFNADNVKHHIYAWPVSLLYCFVFRFVFAEFQSHISANVTIYFHLPAYLALLYIGGALMLSWRRSRRLETHAHETTRRMAKRILPYLGVFAVHTIVSFIIYLVELNTSFDSMTPNALDQLSLVLETLAVFALFCRDAGVFKALNGGDAGDGSSGDASNSSNPSRTTIAQIPAGGATLMSTSGGGAAPNGNHAEKIDVSNKLRMDVMRYMSLGIMESIKQAQLVEEAAAGGSGSGGCTGSDTDVALPDTGGCNSDVTYDAYNRVVSMGVIVYGQKGNNSVLTFRDCAPKIFHRIRAQFDIDQDFYMQSFDPAKLLSEHGSEGKSGNIFYFTGASPQFMVKSVPKEEFDTLRAILPQYHEYLQSNPQSMLCRYFGCHSISLPIGTRRMYFVVMQNLFNGGPVDQRFDLKGNRDRRQAVSATDMEGLIQIANDKQPISQLMMDIDFLKLSSGISLSYANTALQQDQLCSDVVFLASRGIIDYSILLGVRYHSPDKRELHQGGFSSHDREEVYYVGIVDMLQRYNWRWTVQRWLLGVLLCKDTHDVSAVPPDEYGTRLADFVREKLFDIQGNSSASSFRNGGGRCLASDHTGESGYSSVSTQGHSYAFPEHTALNMAAMESTRRKSVEMKSLAVFTGSLDSQSMDPSSSSSPSVAYSSVDESPISQTSDARKSTTFFV